MKILFGDSGLSQFRSLSYDREIAAKAREFGIASSVAVHHLDRKRMLDYKFGNRLFVDLAGTFTA